MASTSAGYSCAGLALPQPTSKARHSRGHFPNIAKKPLFQFWLDLCNFVGPARRAFFRVINLSAYVPQIVGSVLYCTELHCAVLYCSALPPLVIWVPVNDYDIFVLHFPTIGKQLEKCELRLPADDKKGVHGNFCAC